MHGGSLHGDGQQKNTTVCQNPHGQWIVSALIAGQPRCSRDGRQPLIGSQQPGTIYATKHSGFREPLAESSMTIVMLIFAGPSNTSQPASTTSP